VLERDCIQSRGFQNTEKDGQIVGFQFTIRSLYYRGLWLSQLRPATVWVNTEEFGPETITWTIKRQTYTHEEMAKCGDIHWGLLDLATINVEKPGGLGPGLYEIRLSYTYSASYLPPRIDTLLGNQTHVRKLVMV
jgi:hypothetical protein